MKPRKTTARSWSRTRNGDGTFTDVSQSSGIAKHLGKAWGVVATVEGEGLEPSKL